MIGILITYLLKASAGLTALVDLGSIYPYVINENTKLPAIVYTMDSVSPSYTSDGWSGDTVTFSVVSFSNNYSNLQDIVWQIREALELKNGSYGDVNYWNILMVSLSEGYNINEDVYMNKMTFSVEITQY